MPIELCDVVGGREKFRYHAPQQFQIGSVYSNSEQVFPSPEKNGHESGERDQHFRAQEHW